MSLFNPFRKKQAYTPPPLTGDPGRDATEILLRIEAHLGELATRSRNLDRLEKRLQGIETALKHI